MNFTAYYSLFLKLFFFLSQYAVTLLTASKTPRNASLTDLSKCKLTQFGTDYMGSTATTAGGIRCQMWHTEKPLHKVSEAIADTDFPERSSQLARNYCRNPTKDPRGPWCYTMEPTLIDDECEVPLCNFGECRVSGTGSEYGGTHDTTSSGRKCKSWDKRLKLAINKTEKFSNNHFSDLSRNKAKNFCRNPDSSSGGPWCWVDSEDYDIVEREYCSVPFCDDKDCLVYSKNGSVYSTLTSLNSTFGNITFSIKLWNPADEHIGQARLLFTHLQVPTSAKVIAQEWRAGVEIILSNSGSGQEYPHTDDETEFEETPSILLGSKWTVLWVAWGGGFISVGHQGATKPIFLDEFKKKNTISSMYPESFFQYGIMGTGVLWSMPFCEDTCEVHTTFGLEFLRVWPLLQSNTSHDLQFHTRASHKATIQLTQTPAVPYPCLLIVIGHHDSTLVMYQEKESSLKEILLDLETKRILNYWAWHEFTISIFGMAIQMFWHRDYGRQEVFSIQHHSIPTLRWFSIGSENTIVHWTLFCAPTEADVVEPPWFPNCVSSSSDSRYEGSQWTTENQIPCIPWISNRIPKTDKQDIFIDGSALKALNKCRNPTNDPEGPFCYTASQSGSSSVKKQYCPIRKCRSSECKMSGTANDYLGTMSVTRSGRKCARWVTEHEAVTAARKNISLGSLMASAFMSLKVKRENALKDSILNIQNQGWDEVGLRSRLPRDTQLAHTRRTARQPRVIESHKQNRIHRLVRYPEVLAISSESTDDDDGDSFHLEPATFPSKQGLEATSKSSSDPTRHQEVWIPDTNNRKLLNYHPGTFQPYAVEKITSEPPEDDGDDDDDLFNLKPATFPPKKSSKATSKSSSGLTRHQEVTDNDKLLYYHPGTFQPYGIEKSTSESSEDDDDDFFNLKPATFSPEKKPRFTSKSSSGTTRHQDIRKPDDNDNKSFNYHPGTFQPYGIEKTTSESSEDDDDDFFNLKPATFLQKKKPRFTSKSSSGTTRRQDIRKPDDNDNKSFNYHPGTFQPYGIEKTTSESSEDDDDFFNLKPATFSQKKKPRFTSESTSGTTRHQDIRKPDDNDNKSFNYHPGTFQPYGIEKTTSESSEEDDDFFNLKPATFSKKKKPRFTSKSTSGTTRHQDIRKPDDNDNKSFNYHPGTFQPYGIEKTTSESPEEDDDDYDLFNLKPATFLPKQSSEATSKSTAGTTRQAETWETTSERTDDDDNLRNYHPGTFQPYGIEKTTSESPEEDDDDYDLFNLKPATLSPKQSSEATSKSTAGTTRQEETWETTSERPDDDDNLLNHHPGTFQPYENTETTSKSPGPRDISTNDSSLTTLQPPANDTSKKPPLDKFSHTTPPPQSTDGSTIMSTKKNNVSTPIHKVDPRYLNDTLYTEQSAKNATNYCRNPSRNIAGTWCYTTDPDVPQDLCNVRDCEQPEECTFLVRGHGSGRRLYVLPEYRSEGLHFSLKEWEPDHPDSITFVILSEDDVQSRLILKVGAMNNEKVLLYYETKEEGIKLVKQKTLPHLLYLGRWTGFVIRMDRGEIKLSYEGAPYPLFEWKDPEPAKAFLPIYYYYSSELGNSIGVAFNCDTKYWHSMTEFHTECHIEQTTTTRFSRILPISIWEKEETPSPHRLVLMLRGEGVILLPLLMLPTTPGYYALTIGEIGQWIFFIKNKLPVVHILHKQDANGPLFTSDTWTNITITFHNATIQVLRNGTEVFHYIHNLPLLFYLFSLSVDTGGWVTWAANCIPTDIDGAPLDGGWSEWGPWTCSASCNGGMGVRKRTCDNPEPNIRGQPCLGPSTSSGHCNMNKCGDVTDVTLALIKRRMQIQHKSIIIKEGDEATLAADTDIVSALRNETATSEINWSRNGIFLEEEEDRIKLEDTAVSISYSVVNDSGVYTQILHRVDDSQLIFKIFTLAVIPTRSELVIRETLPFSVTCHCVVLGYIYSDLKVSWILNGRVFKDYGVSTPIAVNVDHIPKANTSHHGEWRCEVVQSDLNFKWTTNVIKVRVLGPPNWRTHLMEDKLTSPIFGWMPSEGFVAFSAFFLTILIIVGIVASTIWYLRFQKSLKYKDLQKKDQSDGEESFNDSENEQLIAKKK